MWNRRALFEFFDDDVLLAAPGGPIQPSGIASGEAFGSTAVLTAIRVSGIASAEAFGTPTIQKFAGDEISGEASYLDLLSGQAVYVDALAGESQL